MVSELGFGRAKRGAIAALTSSILGASALAGCVAVDTDSRGGDGPRIYTGMDEQVLSAASAAPAKQVVGEFLSTKGMALGDELRVASDRTSTSTGLRHVRFEQQAFGLRVVDGYVKASFNAQGELVHVIEQLQPRPDDGLEEPSITPAEALGVALDELGYETETPVEVARDAAVVVFEQGEVFHAEPTVERVAVETDAGLEEGYLVETWAEDTNLLHHTVLDGEGQLVSIELRTNTDSYNVFVEDPWKAAQTVVAGPGAGTAASPAGWLSGSQTSVLISGNNARAYLDADNNNAADSGGSAVTSGAFLAAVDFGVEPTTATNEAVSVQNLFYLNNVVHDALYVHGFDEAAGNFQSSNFGLGGLGSDPVNAEAQDGGGTDNANFATPTDGSSPRMQMYLWSGNGPDAQVSVGAQSFGGKQAGFGPTLTNKNGLLALVVDGGGTSPNDGCEAIALGSLSNRIALLDRGTCDFTLKVLNAQKAGAIAVVVANNDASVPFAMGGTNRKITVPSMMVSQNDGNALRSLLAQSATMSPLPEPVMVDGSLDADVVFHEFGHGLTWRMIGSMSGALAGAIGEGASDVVAFLLDGDDTIGEYAASDARGIRRSPYATHTLSYADVTGAEVHDDGEVYAAAMWRLLELSLAAGQTADDVLELFVAGMDLTPAKPTFEQMRDGMLAASADPADDCRIWRAFAAKGVGVGAKATVKGARVTIAQSFTVPAECM